MHKFSSLIDISKSVLEGLVEKKPIVALETTIVTHGMPYPQNKETALEVEELIMQQVMYFLVLFCFFFFLRYNLSTKIYIYLH